MSKYKRICLWSSVHFWQDSRLYYKFYLSLKKAGANVVLAARRGSSPKTSADSGVILLPNYHSRIFRFVVLNPLAFFRVLLVGADMYIIHDPELIPFALLLQLFWKKEVYYDVHEDYSELIFEKKWIKGVLTRNIVSKLANFFEKKLSKYFTGLFIANPSQVGGFTNKNIIIIRNFPLCRQFKKEKTESFLRDKKKTLVYLGSITEARGIKTMLTIIERLDPDTELLLAGRWENDRSRVFAMTTKGWSRVRELGHINYKKISLVFQNASLGLLLLDKHYRSVLPTKAYEYLLSGLPVVAYNYPEWMRTFKKGVVFVPQGNLSGIVVTIKKLLADKKRLCVLGSEGMVFARKYCWEKEKDKLLKECCS